MQFSGAFGHVHTIPDSFSWRHEQLFAGAYNPERATPILGLCHGVFAYQFIFRHILGHFSPRKQNLHHVYERIRSIRYQKGKLNFKKVACSQTLYFLFKVRRALVIKYKPQGIYGPPAQGGIFLSRAPRSFSRACFARELADVFEKNEKKNKTSSVYRLLTGKKYNF